MHAIAPAPAPLIILVRGVSVASFPVPMSRLMRSNAKTLMPAYGNLCKTLVPFPCHTKYNSTPKKRQPHTSRAHSYCISLDVHLPECAQPFPPFHFCQSAAERRRIPCSFRL